jgi:hypothetical protein
MIARSHEIESSVFRGGAQPYQFGHGKLLMGEHECDHAFGENHSYAYVKRIEELGKRFERELEEFFVNYHQLSGKEFRILGVHGPTAARRRIRHAREAAR